MYEETKEKFNWKGFIIKFLIILAVFVLIIKLLPFASDNTKQLKLKVTWNAASTATISDDVTVTVGESTFVYTQN